jgi:hypothetical protein
MEKTVKIAAIILLSALNIKTVISQDLSLLRPEIIPPSPDVVNQMKFVETPVSLFTGCPQISIPIYTIQEGNHILPITLDYNPGGIKVSEIASWVGLAWTLSAGGTIGRAMIGLPDEYDIGFLNTAPPILANYGDQLVHAKGWKDNQPDMFYFQFAGHSGRFFFDKSGTVHTVPKTDFKIEKEIQGITFNGSVGHGIVKWVITTNDGIRYTFNDYELGTSQGLSDHGSPNPMVLVNSWHLSKIEFPEGGMITLNYTTNYVIYDVFSGMNTIILYSGTTGSSPLLPRITWLGMKTNVKHLSAINFSNGCIRFVKKERERADLRKDYALQKIVLENNSGTVLNQWEFNYQILEGTSLLSYETISLTGNNFVSSSDLYGNSIPAPMKRRLMLTGIKELDAAGTAKNSGYSFEYYHTVTIPHRFYPLTDHWGYANGDEIQNPFTHPQVSYISGKYHITVDKNPDLNRTKQGTLYKIIHPTRGETQFEYELHTFSNGSMPGSVGTGNNQAGGLRVKKCTYYDPVTGKSNIKNYKYSLDEYGIESFSGTILGSPVYYREYGERKGGLTAMYLVISSRSLYPLATAKGSYVAYKQATEEITDISGNPLGKSFYSYTLFFDEFLNNFEDNIPSIFNPNYPTLFPNPFPYSPGDSRDWCNGLLISRKDYAYENNAYKEVYSQHNIWKETIENVVRGYNVGISNYELNEDVHSLRVAFYNVSTGTMKLKQTTEKEKRDNVWVTRQKAYEYGESQELPIHTEEILEDGKKMHQYFSYPKEYATGTGFIDNLKAKNILNTPIETVSVLEDNQNLKITSGKIIEYSYEGFPSLIKLLELGSPLDKNQFRFSSMNGTGILPGNGNKGIYTPDSRYKERAVLTYDRGRLYSHMANDMFTYYLWGYNRQYPVVQITSGESLNLKSKLTTSELTNIELGNYTIENMITVLDKIRIAYKSNPNVLVETYTYLPLRGIVNKIAPNGIKTKNEYDTFGRLKKFYLNDLSIESYDYHYGN